MGGKGSGVGSGSKPGERRGGRQKGAPNKIGADVRELARQYTTQAIDTLAHIMRKGKNEQARSMAADKLLDRGWGKAPVSIELAGHVTVSDLTDEQLAKYLISGSGDGVAEPKEDSPKPH